MRLILDILILPAFPYLHRFVETEVDKCFAAIAEAEQAVADYTTLVIVSVSPTNPSKYNVSVF